MAHANKTRQFAYLGMVHCESFSAQTVGGQTIEWPAVAKVNVVMEIGFYIKERAVLSTGILVSVLEHPFSHTWAIVHC